MTSRSRRYFAAAALFLFALAPVVAEAQAGSKRVRLDGEWDTYNYPPNENTPAGMGRIVGYIGLSPSRGIAQRAFPQGGTISGVTWLLTAKAAEHVILASVAVWRASDGTTENVSAPVLMEARTMACGQRANAKGPIPEEFRPPLVLEPGDIVFFGFDGWGMPTSGHSVLEINAALTVNRDAVVVP